MWKNLLSTGNAFTEVDLVRNTSTLIIGTNGAGKSTILDAIMFVLFGVAFRNINKPNLINSVNDRELEVWVEFIIGKKAYRVGRGSKPAFFKIFVNGELLPENAVVGDYQAYLQDSILGCNEKAFKQIVALGNASFESFMNLRAADRREIIENLLDIQVFSSMNKVLKDKLTAVKNQAGEISKDIQSIKAQIELQQRHVKDAEGNAQEQIAAIEVTVTEKRKELDELQTALILLEMENTVYAMQDLALDAKKNKLLKLEKMEEKMVANVTIIRKELAFYESNPTCPKCSQPITTERHINEMLTLETKKKEYDEALINIALKIEEVKADLKETMASGVRQMSIKHEINEKTYKINNIKYMIDAMAEQQEALRNRKPLSDEMIAISKQLVTKLTSLIEDQKKNGEERTYLEAAALLLKDSGIKAKIVKQYLPVINKLVNKYLSTMDFFVNFELNEEFKETIKSRYCDEFSYANFSEGEKIRIDLALIFTWREIARLKNSMNTNLLVLDEILDGSLDNDGIEKAMKLINSFGEETNIFVISHRQDVLIDKFKGLIRFNKVGNFSRMVA